MRRRFSTLTPLAAFRYFSHMDLPLSLRSQAAGRRCDYDTSGDVLRQPHDLIGEARHVLLAHIGQQQIDLIVARRGLMTFGGACDAAAVQRLVQVGSFR